MSAKRKRYFGRVVDAEAGIVLLSDYVNLYKFSKEINKSLKSGLHIVCGLCWSLESPKRVLKILAFVLRNRLLFPKIKISILANTPKEHRVLQLLRLFNVKCVYCNHNCFIDERVMTVKPNAAKHYDAVYNGVLSAYKRHLLAKDVKRLALITYRFENQDYKNYLDQHLADPVWINYADGSQPSFLNNEQVVEVYNASHAGLALSAIEGPMFASCEYLFCGIPVVTTKSKGGRDIFFSKENAVVVEDTAEAVAAAVQDLKDAAKDPYAIREKTLELAMQHRKQFAGHINSILRSKGFTYNCEDTRDKWFVHKMRGDLYADELIEALNAFYEPKPSY